MVSVQNKAKSLLLNHRLAADTEVDPENGWRECFRYESVLIDCLLGAEFGAHRARGDRPRLGSRQGPSSTSDERTTQGR